MNLFQRLKNLYKLSGVELSDNKEVFQQSETVKKITEIFKPKRMASIVDLHAVDEFQDA